MMRREKERPRDRMAIDSGNLACCSLTDELATHVRGRARDILSANSTVIWTKSIPPYFHAITISMLQLASEVHDLDSDKEDDSVMYLSICFFIVSFWLCKSRAEKNEITFAQVHSC
jgi:hypothetical protein